MLTVSIGCDWIVADAQFSEYSRPGNYIFVLKMQYTKRGAKPCYTQPPCPVVLNIPFGHYHILQGLPGYRSGGISSWADTLDKSLSSQLEGGIDTLSVAGWLVVFKAIQLHDELLVKGETTTSPTGPMMQDKSLLWLPHCTPTSACAAALEMPNPWFVVAEIDDSSAPESILQDLNAIFKGFSAAALSSFRRGLRKSWPFDTQLVEAIGSLPQASFTHDMEELPSDVTEGMMEHARHPKKRSAEKPDADNEQDGGSFFKFIQTPSNEPPLFKVNVYTGDNEEELVQHQLIFRKTNDYWKQYEMPVLEYTAYMRPLEKKEKHWEDYLLKEALEDYVAYYMKDAADLPTARKLSGRTVTTVGKRLFAMVRKEKSPGVSVLLEMVLGHFNMAAGVPTPNEESMAWFLSYMNYVRTVLGACEHLHVNLCLKIPPVFETMTHDKARETFDLGQVTRDAAIVDELQKKRRALLQDLKEPQDPKKKKKKKQADEGGKGDEGGTKAEDGAVGSKRKRIRM